MELIKKQRQHINSGSGTRSRPFFAAQKKDGPAPFFQAKLKVNQANDAYEQEADAMAQKVVDIQTGTAIAEDAAYGRPILRKLDSGSAGGNASLENTPAVLNTSGSSMEPADRKFYEQRFKTDFSGVKIYTDSAAATSASALNARAYTIGNNIVFNTGEYSPATRQGKLLLGHELTHVVQQTSGSAAQIQRATDDEAAASVRSNELVQQYIDKAFADNGYNVESAFRDLQSRRCLSENCGNENLAAAEHYMFARHLIEDQWIMPEIVIAAILGYSLAKFAGLAPSLCDCPVTPTSLFQVDWAIGVLSTLILLQGARSITRLALIK